MTNLQLQTCMNVNPQHLNVMLTCSECQSAVCTFVSSPFMGAAGCLKVSH